MASIRKVHLSDPPAVARAAIVGISLSCAAFCAGAGCTSPFARFGPSPGPTSADYYAQGIAELRAGNREAAIRSLTEATRRNPDFADAHSALGDIYKQSGDHASAAVEYEAVTRLEPGAANNHHRLAVSYHFLNRLRDAAASYVRAIQLNPTDWKSNMNLGLVYMALGQNNAAVEHAQRAVSLNPLSTVALTNLGVTLDARGNPVEAEAAYRKALHIDPGQTTAAQNLVINLLARNRAEEAVDLLTGVLTTTNTPALRRRYGDALAQAGRQGEALAQYREALKADPRYAAAMNGIATVLIKQYQAGLLLDDRKRDEAILMWRRSLEINPNQPKIAGQLRLWKPRAA